MPLVAPGTFRCCSLPLKMPEDIFDETTFWIFPGIARSDEPLTNACNAE
jgi:hypothetical protein